MLAVSHVSCATLCLLFALCLSPLNSSYQFADFTLTLVGIIFDYFVCVCVCSFSLFLLLLISSAALSFGGYCCCCYCYAPKPLDPRLSF